MAKHLIPSFNPMNRKGPFLGKRPSPKTASKGKAGLAVAPMVSFWRGRFSISRQLAAAGFQGANFQLAGFSMQGWPVHSIIPSNEPTKQHIGGLQALDRPDRVCLFLLLGCKWPMPFCRVPSACPGASWRLAAGGFVQR